MQELTDDQLDGLFRKSAEEFEPSFDPAAWQTMQSRLDNHDRTASGPPQWRSKLIRWGVPFLLFLLLTGSALYLFRRSGASLISNRQEPVQSVIAQRPAARPQSEAVRESATDPAAPATAAPHSRVSVPRAAESVSTSEPARVAMATANRLAPVGSETQSASRLKVDRRAGRNSDNRSVAVETPVSPGFNTGNLMKRQRRIAPDNAPVTAAANSVQRTAARTSRAATTPSLIRQSAITANPDWTPTELEVALNRPTQMATPSPEVSTGEKITVQELRIRPGQWPKSLAFTNRSVQYQPDMVSEPEQPVSKPVRERGLSVRFLVSPDLSAVGLKNFARPGTNVGLMLEYRLAARWSVQAGVLRSTKVYRATTADYELPDYTTNWPLLPESVSGRCAMLDIPINLRYDFALQTEPDGRVRSRWFVTGGATTYVMQQEEYTYHYTDPNSPHIYPNMKGWNGSTGRYNFSQLNFSVGYERALSQRLSWQVEPFLKMPLQGIGYYRINLLSTGAFLSLRYKL